ncbi:MAG: hypothetical protein RBT63_08810, partial [Bdellovibrionales bacterium]|nr:hypothetical protein [Bdellovibrionales bacterium]
AAGAVTTGVAIAAVGTKALLASTALAGLTTAATAAWTAITGPVGLAVAGIGALGAALYAAYKHWDLIRAGAYSALAATLEFAARGAEAIGSGGMAAALRDQAAEYKKLSSAARAEYDEQSKAAADHTQKYINSSRQRSAAIDEETQKRQQALNDWAQKLAQSVEDESAQNKLRLEDLSLWYDEQAALEGESETINFEARLERERIFFDERKAIQDEMYQAELARVEQSDLTEEERLKARIALEQQYLLQSGKNNVDYSNRQMSIRKAQEAFEAEQNRKKLNSTALLFGALRELTVNGSREAFQISKSFGIAEATIKGYQAVQNAYATGGPFPFNIAAGLAMGIQTALQIRNIVSQQPPAFKEGGIVPGTSYVGDRVTARVNSGEMILNTRQQANLFSLANGSGSSNNETNALLIQLIETVRSSTSISIDGREIFSVMRDGFSDGRRLA